MIICYLRSSSWGTYDMCEQKYYLNYVLGKPDKDNAKAVMGTAVHKDMELLAKLKLARNDGKDFVDDDELGRVDVDIDLRNLHDRVFDKYDAEYPGLMDKEGNPREITWKWTNKALEYRDGLFNPENQNISSVEEFFDFEIKQDWAKYEYEVNGETMTGYLRLRGTVDLIIKEDADFYHIQDYKGLPLDTPIPTPNGWTTMGKIQVGDICFDKFGRQTKVVAKSQVKTKRCYEIIFDDTSVAQCDEEHLWEIADGSVVPIQDLKIGDTIRVADPIDCDVVELPIDPYVLGVWLGDGRNRSGEITSGDECVFEEIERRGFSLGVNSEKRKTSCQTRTILGLTTQLRPLGLLHNKHIPEKYLRASYNQRLELLRGLMDSDGYANETRKQCVFMNCSRQLSEGVKQLLLTLGQRPYLCPTQQKYKDRIVNAYPVFFRPLDIQPFFLDRKNDKISGWGYGHSKVRRVKNIIKMRTTQQTQCIAVDSEDQTYLCTTNFIPTHNTGRRWCWATDSVKTYEKLCKDKQLRLYYYALRNKYPERDFFVSIYYINDYKIDGKMVPGGVYTMAFDDEDYKQAENDIRKKFEEIRDNEQPKLLSNTCSHWKCKYLCAYSQIDPEIDPEKPICMAIRDQIHEIGIRAVTEEHGDLSKLNQYTGGGKSNIKVT